MEIIIMNICIIITVLIIQEQKRIGTNSFKNITVMSVLINLLILCINNSMLINLNPILSISIKRVQHRYLNIYSSDINLHF